ASSRMAASLTSLLPLPQVPIDEDEDQRFLTEMASGNLQQTQLPQELHRHLQMRKFPQLEPLEQQAGRGQCIILLPAFGGANDAMRLRNGGRRLEKVRPNKALRVLHTAASEPSLGNKPSLRRSHVWRAASPPAMHE
ncbi:unnamed protein product, partial [Polarella glacialis]